MPKLMLDPYVVDTIMLCCATLLAITSAFLGKNYTRNRDSQKAQIAAWKGRELAQRERDRLVDDALMSRVSGAYQLGLMDGRGRAADLPGDVIELDQSVLDGLAARIFCPHCNLVGGGHRPGCTGVS